MDRFNLGTLFSVGILVATVGFALSAGSSGTSSGAELQIDCRQEISELVPAIGAADQIQLITFADVVQALEPNQQMEFPGVSLPLEVADAQQRDGGSFPIFERMGNGLQPIRVTLANRMIQSGHVVGNPESSRFTLYRSGSVVSGFVITDVNDHGAPWYFIEPVLPLLRLQAEFDLSADSDLESCVAGFAESDTHVVYNARNTDFSIVLEHAQADLPSPLPNEVTSLLQPRSSVVDIVGVGDTAFYGLFDGASGKTWWQAQEEVLTVVVDFYKSIGIEFNLLALEAWTSDGPGAAILGGADLDHDGDLDPGDGLVDVNAFNLLCDFAEGIVLDMNLDSGFSNAEVTEDSAARHPPINHKSPRDRNDAFVVHLFSGYDLGPVPFAKATKISDSGCCLCEGGPECGTQESAIVGLAQKAGGIWGNISNLCTLGSNSSAEIVREKTHHSLSQYVPESTSKVETPNQNNQGLLFQRALLLAHEVGHSLGARHSDDQTTIMSPQLENIPKVNLLQLELGSFGVVDNARLVTRCVTEKRCTP